MTLALLATLGQMALPTAPQAAAAAPAQALQSPLTRKQALEQAAQQNLGLLIQRLEVLRQERRADAQWAPYIPTLWLDGSYGDDPPVVGLLDVSAPPNATRQRRIYSGGQVQWQSPIGSTLTLRAQQNDPVGDGAGTPRHETSLSLSLRQSLLRNGGLVGAATPVTLADLAVQAARQIYIDQLNALLVEADVAYSQLVLSQADLDIKTRSVQRAQQQFEETRRNIEQGLVPPGEIYVVEENLVFFEQQRVRSEESLRLAQRQLSRLLQRPPGEELVVVDDLDVGVEVPNALEATQRGLHRNGALRAQRLELEQAQVRLAFEENQILPTLDIEGTLALNGIDTDLGRAWSAAVGVTRPEGRVGLLFSLPLAYAPSFRRVEEREAEVKQQVLRLKDAELSVTFSIENLLTQLTKQREQVRLAQRRLELATLKLEAEREKYANGVTTLTDVVRFQRELDDAAISLRRTQVELLTSRARLMRATGTLHDAMGIVVDYREPLQAPGG